MTTIFTKDVRIGRVLTTNVEQAMALGDSMRAMIADMLAIKPMSVEEIVQELRKNGVRKAPTTVRHHVDVLKQASVIELARVEEMRGGVLKYYASKVKVLGHNYPADLEEKLAEPISEAADKLMQTIKEVTVKHRDKIKEIARNLKPCRYCAPEHFVENTIVEILNMAISVSLQRKEFASLVKELSARR